jgi:hypothetical protein
VIEHIRHEDEVALAVVASDTDLAHHSLDQFHLPSAKLSRYLAQPAVPIMKILRASSLHPTSSF